MSARNAADGHNEPCWYCKEPCDALAANPGKWPLLLPLDQGKCVAACRRCVLDRLKRADEVAARAHNVAVEVQNAPTPEGAGSYLSGFADALRPAQTLINRLERETRPDARLIHPSPDTPSEGGER
jgi:hypothetical protein